MALNEKPKLLTGVIICLLLLNFGTLLFLWTHNGAPGRPEHRRPDVFGYLVNELKLTEAQQKEYAALRDEHHEKVEALRRQSRNVHDSFFKLMSQNTDTVSAVAMADSIAGIQKEIEMVTFNHFKQVRSICTPEQQKKFDAIIEEALRMMAPPPPPGR